MYSSNQILGTKAGISILGILLLGILLIFVLSYFHVSIRGVVESPDAKDNVQYVGGATKDLWTTYFKEPADYLWNKIWIPYFWEPFVDTLKKLKSGESTDMQNSGQLLPSNY